MFLYGVGGKQTGDLLKVSDCRCTLIFANALSAFKVVYFSSNKITRDIHTVQTNYFNFIRIHLLIVHCFFKTLKQLPNYRL